nr:hypothetical protein [Angustibacter aerolatus]
MTEGADAGTRARAVQARAASRCARRGSPAPPPRPTPSRAAPAARPGRPARRRAPPRTSGAARWRGG